MTVFVIKKVSKYYSEQFSIAAIVEYETEAKLIVKVANTSEYMSHTFEYEEMEVE